MLSDRLSQLLTAYIDGELSARQRKAVQRLLHRSAEARALVRQMEEDARLLRGLPRRKLGPDFAQRVLGTIADRPVQLSRRARLSRVPAYPAWGVLAAAAAVLFVVGISTYLY